MANWNQNYQAVPLVSGDTYTYIASASSPIHQFVCLEAGSARITAVHGGTFVWSATTSQSIDVVSGGCVIVDGSFVGFRTKHQQTQQASLPYYNQ